MGVGPVCQTSLSTGLSEWDLGYISHTMQNRLLYVFYFYLKTELTFDQFNTFSLTERYAIKQ